MNILHLYQQPKNTRGVAVFRKNLLAMSMEGVKIDTFHYRSAISDEFPGGLIYDDYTSEEIAEIANRYEYVVLSNYPADFDFVNSFWHLITKPVKVIINHGDIFQMTRFDNYTVPLLKTADGILTYSSDNKLSRHVKKFHPELSRKIYTFKSRLYFPLYKDKIEKSFNVERHLPYVIESGSWEARGSKNHAEISKLLSIADESGIIFDPYIFIHIGISFNPGVYFGHVKKYPNNTVKCGRKIDRYMDDDYQLNIRGSLTNKVFLMRDYEHDWMYDLMIHSPYSYSLMTTQYESGRPNHNIAGRFEYSQLEKCMYSLPIFETNFLELFEGMNGETRNSFLEVNVLDNDRYRMDIPALRENMEYLLNHRSEYDARRRKIIEYVEEQFSIEGIIEEITIVEKL